VLCRKEDSNLHPLRGLEPESLKRKHDIAEQTARDKRVVLLHSSVEGGQDIGSDRVRVQEN
jgi:hypothetical protein